VGPGLDAAADYLGLTRAELGRRLMKGSSLADIARAEGKAVEGLEDAIVAAAKADLDRAVANGDLTTEQRDEMLRGLQEHVDELVAGKGPGPGPGGPGELRMHRFGGPGGPGGPPPWGDERGTDRAQARPGAFEQGTTQSGVWN
jgi:hypothetical protein